MFEFLKRLFYNQDQDLTFVLFNEEKPESSTSYNFKPARLWKLFYVTLIGAVVTTLLLAMFTPLGGLLYSSRDAQMHEQVVNISQKVQALQDSLDARDNQLFEMQQVISSGEDTNFTVRENFDPSGQKNPESWEQKSFTEVSADGMISQNELIFSDFFKETSNFPSDYPIDGTLTRGYDPANGHYGIDIATKKGTSFKAIANGAIVDQDWTVNYGFVMHLQHSNGIITVYKHAASVSKSIGDFVTKGDILGTAGDVGVLSSGPHLHIEIWKNGVPQNPNTYLIK